MVRDRRRDAYRDEREGRFPPFPNSPSRVRRKWGWAVCVRAALLLLLLLLHVLEYYNGAVTSLPRMTSREKRPSLGSLPRLSGVCRACCRGRAAACFAGLTAFLAILHWPVVNVEVKPLLRANLGEGKAGPYVLVAEKEEYVKPGEKKEGKGGRRETECAAERGLFGTTSFAAAGARDYICARDRWCLSAGSRRPFCS